MLALLQGVAGLAGQMSPAELCAAQRATAGGFNDPYRGPYLAAIGAGNLTNCSGLGSPPMVVVAAPPPGALHVPGVSRC